MEAMSPVSLAWMLDVEDFHREFDELFAGLATPEGVVRMRERAGAIWRSQDPIVAAYIGLLRTATPDEWETTFDDQHVIDWYRVLMAPFLIPTRAFRSRDLLKRRLPDLGWSPSESRRLAQGRELQLLCDAYAGADVVTQLNLHFTLGHKGWLSQEDVQQAIQRFRGLDRRAFRGRSELVPLAENAFEVLEAAATKPDHVLLMVND
jgi:hypothetical protein